MRKTAFITPFLLTLAAMLACGFPEGTPTADEVATQVSKTLTAVAATPVDEPTSTSTPEVIEDPEDELHSLLYLREGELYRFNLEEESSEPFPLVVVGDLQRAILNPDQIHLAYLDDAGLHVRDLQSEAELVFLPRSTEPWEVFSPKTWSDLDLLLVDRYFGSENSEVGWLSLGIGDFQVLDPPEGVNFYGCYTGVDWATLEERLAITGLGYAHPCNGNPGLTVIDIAGDTVDVVVQKMVDAGLEGEIEIIAGGHTPSWSSDAEWIAFGLDENAVEPLDFPTRLYIAHPDGSELTPVSANASGIASAPAWITADQLYYALNGEGPGDGIYSFNIGSLEHNHVIPETDLYPVSVSPDGNLLLYSAVGRTELRAWVFDPEQTITIPEVPNDSQVSFVGWLVGP